ncbi:MAG: ribonuclease HI family protein [Patescibacteria group bacterium]|nr:ribonuclease HI family protein [Patescibacteria group bacterium]
MQKIFLNTDGGSRGNPGIAGAGAAISNESGEVLQRASKALGTMTNNEAEYSALILGLETAKKMLGKEKAKQAEVVARLDSELVTKQLNGEYQIKEERLFPLFIRIWNMRVANFGQLSFTYVPREQNKVADQLANEAMDQQTKQAPLM